MKTIIGPVAEGDFYFDRPYLDKSFWKKMRESHNVSIVAPRRVGKTSFLMNLLAKNESGFQCIYLITESINSPNEFFKKLYKVVYTELSLNKKIKRNLDSLVNRLQIKKVSTKEIEFEKTDINYYEEILILCRELNAPTERIVLLVDEFSQTIENIITDLDREAAKIFLHQCRELRQNPEFRTKIGFVYAGSIGLNNLVFSLDEPRSISDLGHFEIPPLSNQEANHLIDLIMDGENYEFPKNERNYFLSKLKWLLPFFIQVIMSELENICIGKGSKKINGAEIDEAFKNALDNRSYFEHWLSRLRSIFKGNDFSCAKEILNSIAKKGKMDYYDLQNILEKFKIVDLKTIINTLLHDGYLTTNQANHTYRFNSPLLQAWWLANVVI